MITLELDNRQVTNWAHQNGLAPVDWETEDDNAYHDRELQNPHRIELDFDCNSESPDKAHGVMHPSYEFYGFHYICNHGKAWPVDVEVPEWLAEKLIDELEKLDL